MKRRCACASRRSPSSAPTARSTTRCSTETVRCSSAAARWRRRCRACRAPSSWSRRATCSSSRRRCRRFPARACARPALARGAAPPVSAGNRFRRGRQVLGSRGARPRALRARARAPCAQDQAVKRDAGAAFAPLRAGRWRACISCVRTGELFGSRARRATRRSSSRLPSNRRRRVRRQLKWKANATPRLEPRARRAGRAGAASESRGAHAAGAAAVRGAPRRW